MKAWLKGLFHWGVSGITDVWNKFVSVINAVYSYISSIDSAIWDEFSSLWDSFTTYLGAVETWASSLYNALYAWTTKALGNTINWASKEISSLGRDISGVVSWASSLISAIRAWVSSLIGNVTSWVIRNIYDPLARALNDALGWIAKEGYYAYHLLTHPELLAKLLAKYLWSALFDIPKRYAGAIAHWLVHQMIHMAGPIGSVLEDIIASIID